MEAHMSGKPPDFKDFFARSTPLKLECVLVVDYLFAQGFLLRDLEDLPPEQAAALFAEARHFARRKLGDTELLIIFSPYLPVGFSQN
jgi:hypothetical protein